MRGSTPLAEKISPSEFTALLNRFYSVTGTAVDEHDGVIDHIAGDGVMAMWIPGFVGEQHAKGAVGAGVQLLESLEEDELALRLPVGGGVHTGTACVGSAGTDRGALDFTVLGDIPNTAARLGSAALAGELLVSRAAALSAALSLEGLERRLLDLKGKAEPFKAWVVRKPVSV